LQVNTLFAPIGITAHFWPIVGTGMLYAGILWVWYIALEPYARRIWPTMLISWSRLLSTAGRRTRDPLIGRSILAGMLAFCVYWIIASLRSPVASALDGVPFRPYIGDWTALLNQRFALAAIAEGVMEGLINGLLLAFILVGARLVTRRQWVAVAIALTVWSVVGLRNFPGNARFGLEFAFLFIGAVLLIAVLLRYGMLAAIVAAALGGFSNVAATPDRGGWHSQPALLCLAFVAVLAGYGFWAASAGRSFVSDNEVFAVAGAGQDA